jgi:hypothetical protein
LVVPMSTKAAQVSADEVMFSSAISHVLCYPTGFMCVLAARS